MNEVIQKLLFLFFYPFSANQRIYWVYLLVALAFSYIIYIMEKANSTQKSGSFLDFLFPKEIYTHRSAVNDYQSFFINSVLQIFFLIPLFTYATPWVSVSIGNMFDQMNLESYEMLPDNSVLWGICFTFLMAMIVDFAVFLGHYIQHKIPWLWEFHKVHHSAEVLTPVTVYRMHPVDNLLVFALGSLAAGVIDGTFRHFCSSEVVMFNIQGTNLILVLFYLLGYNLRHSHIWLDYGRFWSRIFISPAQHQIHHSSEPHHMDKNMGFMFAFWDAIFGTLWIPKGREKFRIGINGREQKQFSSFPSLYIRPFINVAQRFKPMMLIRPKRIALASVFFLLTLPAIYFNESHTSPLQLQITSPIYLQDMTWSEVKRAVESGYNTVLIPTGGTEQNGPHMILGKHNYIVHYTARKIAERLGKTLVAPVIN